MHLKRVAAPKSWPIRRKERKYTIRQNPGPYSYKESVPLGIVLRDILKVTLTKREAKRALHERKIKVNGIVRASLKFPLGLFDIISFADRNYRMLIDSRGKFFLGQIAGGELLKPSKITWKNAVSGKKIQITLNDSRTLLLGKSEHKVGDTLIFSIPGNEVKEALPFVKGSVILLTRGNHTGEVGKVKDIAGSKIIYEIPEKGIFETKKGNAFVVGKEKPIIEIK